MKPIFTTAAAALLIAATAGSAFAQDRHDDHRGGPMYSHGSGMHGPMMGPGPAMRGHPDWRNGGHIARNDWNRGRRVDYRSRHLRRPPRGYEWREVDGNYVLAAAATGLIAGIVLANQ